MTAWSLQAAYDAYPRIEEEFADALDASLDPSGPAMLFDLVAAMGLPTGAAVVDAGCGEGSHAIALADRFGFAVTGVDPVSRHIELAQAALRHSGATFTLGAVEHLPVRDASIDLIWCRDVLVHVADLARAYGEFRRALKPGGRALVYQMFGTDLLEPREAAWLWATMGVVPSSADPATTDAAIAASGLSVDARIELGSEWGEWAQERAGHPGRKLLHAARLLRSRETFAARFGDAACDMMLGDCLWHVYAMIGKLTRRVYLLTAPEEPHVKV